MISTKKELQFYIMADCMMNRGTFKFSLFQKIKHIIFPDYIILYLKYMRKATYYSHMNSECDKIRSIYFRYKLRKLGIKLGFSIAPDVLGYGVVIPHYGTIVVGGGNKIGNYAVLHTSTCITNGQKQIGDGLYISSGAKLTTVVSLGENVMVAANSVVTKSYDESNILLAGMPAHIKKTVQPWYHNLTYMNKIKKVENLKQSFL